MALDLDQMKDRPRPDEQMKEEALRCIQDANPECKDFKSNRLYRNIMNGSVVTVSFVKADGQNDTNHVYWSRGN